MNHRMKSIHTSNLYGQSGQSTTQKKKSTCGNAVKAFRVCLREAHTQLPTLATGHSYECVHEKKLQTPAVVLGY